MKLIPFSDRVILKRIDSTRTTASGIVIPESAAERPSQGVIVAVGTGKQLDSGVVRRLNVEVGDTVLFGKYAGHEFKFEGEDLLQMREDDIICKICE